MFARHLTSIIAVVSVAACSQGDITGPGGDDEPAPPPPPVIRTYDVVVTLKTLKALGDCDRSERVAGVSVGGPGEFAYTVWAASATAMLARVETPDYGKWGTLGASRLIDNGRTHTLNQTLRLTRRTGETFNLGFGAIEWDGVVLTERDKDLNGQSRQRPITLDEVGDGGMSLEVEVGANVDNCGLRLSYDVTRKAR